MMKLRLAQPPMVIDIGRIEALRGVTRDGDTLRIGPLTTHAQLASDATLKEGCPLISEAASKIGDPQVRNRGTLGGNIAHADPASDLPAVLAVLCARIHLQGPGGARTVNAEDFFTGLLETDLGEHEILTGVEIAWSNPGSGSAYRKFEHPASGYALCGAAAVVRLGGDGTVAAAGLAYNGIASTPVMADCSSLVGKRPDAANIAAALEGFTVDDPLSDVQASGEYRVHLARVFGRRALAAAAERAAG
jgi:carbon-monoxide dehydrogenase medium subunit